MNLKKFFWIREHMLFAIKFILIISIFNAIYLELWHMMSASIFLLILLFLPQIIKRRYEVNIPVEFEWILFFFAISTFFIGSIRGTIISIFFGISISLIGFMILLILYSSGQIKKNYFLIIFFSFNFAVTFGFGLEFLKYLLKIILMQEITVGIYHHSMKNMVYVIFGALISSIFGYIYLKEKKGLLNKVIRRFAKINPKLFSEKDYSDIKNIIKKGENENVEFKSTLRVNLYTQEIDRKIEYASLKTIDAFLNSKGGILFIGVSNNGEIIGTEKDRFDNNDKLSLHLTNIIKEKIGKRYLHLINFDLISLEKKTILRIECKKSDRPVFLKPTKDEEEFYIRTGPSSIQIKGSELVDYIDKRFRK
jgi:hypothetical protein